MPFEKKEKLEMDASEFDAMIRDQLDLGSETEPEVIVEKEPEVVEKKTEVVERKEPVVVAKESVVVEAKDDSLAKALSTIETLQRQVSELTETARRPTTMIKEPDVIDLEEVITNVRLPKDKSRWPIRLTQDDVRKLGIDPEITPGLNTLANALYAFVLETIPSVTTQAFESTLSAREGSSKRKLDFYEKYPDLKGQDDFLEMVEGRLRNEGVHQGVGRETYFDKVAEAARTRIASLRGMDLSTYITSLSQSGKEAPRGGTSRAVTTSGGGGSRRQQPAGDDKELLDMLES